jgi:hypothetical protein
MAAARVISVSIGHAVDASRAGRLKRAAIDKHPAAAAGPGGMAEAGLAAAVRPAAPAAG